MTSSSAAATADLAANPPRADQRVPALDGLRGCAILWSVSVHFLDDFRPVSSFDRGFFMMIKVGWVALEVFFALSGYLITAILWDTRGTKNYLLTFYARRLLRIIPVYYGFMVLLVFWITQVNVIDAGESRLMLREQGWYWSFFVNWLIAVRDRWTVAPYHTSHFWSLGVEEQFYMLWPLCVMRCKRETLLKICVAGFLFSVALRLGYTLMHGSPLRTYVATPTRLDSLALGSFVALVARGPEGFRPLVKWVKPVGFGSLLILVAMGVYRGELISSDGIVQVAGFAVIAAGASALIVGCVVYPKSFLIRQFDRPALMRLGRYSYVMYVAHYTLVYIVEKAGFSIQRLQRVVDSLDLATALYVTTMMTLTVGIAALSWNVFERRLQKSKDRWFPLVVENESRAGGQ